ncbi:pyridoxamine 5'-phosphate oxidase family protein [Streptomyces sp. JJ36]|uniref:pyridoxamine 5'-phosphate oxidase family protein n=1 Tax=Streptomyces sp. JJ36 TaxID=2736645 RepID=UPI001F1FC4C0|nr:pyridoxamine 5'-phosphate oxidase family protein [Streptomyces sp. JJ36]MCF6524154.1 pyridoxamine 5'-phosphate oxidase family protein [Streptomyces sp. JJ36]
MALSRAERERFLAEPHVAALSVDSGEESRGPLTVPVWYQYAPGGEVWVLTGRDSRKHRLVARAGRCTLLVQRLEPTVAYVSVEGPVVRTGPGTREALEELAARYLPPEKVQGYVEFALKDHGEQVILYLRPEHWLSADLGAV